MRAEQKVDLPAPAGPMTRTPNLDMVVVGGWSRWRTAEKMRIGVVSNETVQ